MIRITTSLTTIAIIVAGGLTFAVHGVMSGAYAQQVATSHTGVVTFDSDRYKIADMVTITLYDADLNTDSDLIDVYGIDMTTGFIGVNGITILVVTFDDQGWSSQNVHPNCLLDLERLTSYTGLDATQFILVETGKDSGVFVGSFLAPSYWCRPGSEFPEATAGLDLEVNYLDFKDASGEMIEVGASATVGANTGLVSLDRTVYPIPFGEPRDFSDAGKLVEELRVAESASDALVALEGLGNEISRIEELATPADSASMIKDNEQRALFNEILREETNDNILGSLDNASDMTRQSAMDAVTWEDISDNLSENIQAARVDVSSMRSLEDIGRDKARAESDLRDVERVGQSPDRASYFPVHPRAFGATNGIAYIPNGDLTIHVRVTDADYDVSGSGQDVIAEDGEGPVKIFVKRGSDDYMLGTAGGTETGMHRDGYQMFGPIQEIAPGAGIFEADITVRFNHGPSDVKCPDNVDGCILQGDIIQVEYNDPIDSSGDRNTVTDSATFDLRNAVLQSDKRSYLVGEDMVLTLIEPDFDLDGKQAETYTLDLIEWDSDAAILTMGSRGGSAGVFDPEPDSFRETGDSTGIFQTIIEIPEELEGFMLEQNESITLEYVDWSPAGADYVGDEVKEVTLRVGPSGFGATPSQPTRQYEFIRPLVLDMGPYIWLFDVVEIEMMFPYDNLMVGDVIAYILPDSGDAVDDDSGLQHTVKRIVDKRFGVWVTQPDDPEYASNFDLVSENEYVGLVNAVMECMPSDLLYDDGRVSAIDGTRVITELPDGFIDRSWVGKWIEDLFGYCDLSTAPIDTQARYMEKYIDPTG